jgi:hypothetical protein
MADTRANFYAHSVTSKGKYLVCSGHLTSLLGAYKLSSPKEACSWFTCTFQFCKNTTIVGMPFTLYSESSSLVDEQWFESQLNRFTQNHYYKTCYVAEVAALKAFYSGETSVEQAATAITQPISQSPIFRPGDYSDDVVALYQLWTLLIDALVEWPPSRTADLVALFSAMTKVTDLIHRGEILDENCENPSTWAEHPYFHMVWSDKFWRTPGQVARQATNVASRKYQLELYIKQQDVDARLVAVGILECKRFHTSLTHARTLY